MEKVDSSLKMSFYLFTRLLFTSFFFFSSRRRHTSLQGDWSSDVCSSDLPGVHYRVILELGLCDTCAGAGRSEERRVGKECRSRRSPYHAKRKSGRASC